MPERLIESPLVDLGSTSLADLRNHDGDGLRNAVTRLIDHIDDPDNRFGGYNKQRQR
ncbi:MULTISPECIES: hypothetical protein [unclassified Parafrankia]|uniref:hypothetical protein n=1 Tax=unclassified Parafrankia TaxID=2994368 RepID=UPI000DA42ED1|nr:MULTISPECIES: hypothetical protein [unclassified Parafrankia]SQE00731.1 conserved hypothetical protein [Parafrankia sp. Ea1.12]